MNGVKINPEDSIEYAISKFQKICSGVLSELKEYRHYEKPSEIRHRERKSAIHRKMLKEKFEERGWTFKEKKKGI